MGEGGSCFGLVLVGHGRLGRVAVVVLPILGNATHHVCLSYQSPIGFHA